MIINYFITFVMYKHYCTMEYIKDENSRQMLSLPACIEEFVEPHAPVRLFDAFVDGLDMDKLGFISANPKRMGTPGYDPRDMLKLHLYGYFYQVSSSRKLARECKCNLEVMWLIRKLTPDFRTISDFRKKNQEAITKVCNEFDKFCKEKKLFYY